MVSSALPQICDVLMSYIAKILQHRRWPAMSYITWYIIKQSSLSPHVN